MNLLKLARHTVLKIKKASIQNYKALLNANEKAQAASIDPYDDSTPEEMEKIKAVAKTIAIVTDKAYRNGVKGSEVKYFVDKAKNQTSQIISQTKSSMVKNDLGALQNALNAVQHIDIPSQMAGSTAQIPNTTTSQPIEMTDDDYQVDLENKKMTDFARAWAHRNDPYQDISGKSYGDKWLSSK